MRHYSAIKKNEIMPSAATGMDLESVMLSEVSQRKIQKSQGDNITMRACQSLQSCATLCDPTDHSPPGSYVHGSLQKRILEWAAMPSSRRSS